ncbi:MAG: DNA ligase D [Gemmatimonadetes bacterium]|nr:DNA ligase D [Gemmatimonadota bacterium]
MSERDPLVRYRDKRTAGATPEPGVAVPPEDAGSEASGAPTGGLFVIHKHAASRLHWDLRLELGGALRSWAVPKGPSLDPAEKRLAVHVEDHPLEYVDFEDVIPPGNYGAGPMIVWDRGNWVALEDPEAGMLDGKLLFELRGHKLRGVWTLVKLKKTENEWLLIREKRTLSRAELAAAPNADAAVPQESILSGLTVEELGAGVDRGDALARRAEDFGAPRRAVRGEGVKLMLAHTAEAPFSDPEWLFELKLDGYRMIAARDGHVCRLHTRNGNDATSWFPEIVRALRSLPVDDFVVDGEIVMHDEAGRPSFQRLQRRARIRRPMDVKRASLRQPGTFYAFDLLAVMGHDLRSVGLEDRKALLRDLVPPAGPLRFVDHFVGVGEALYEQVTSMGLEGIVGKKTASRYRAGRSRSWLKVRATRTADVVVVGFTEAKGGLQGLGALHVAGREDDRLVYLGRVGTGFSEGDRKELRARLETLEIDAPAADRTVPEGSDHWVRPVLVAEVQFLERTEDGLLRHPVFSHVRDDKAAEECEAPLRRGGASADEGERDFEADSAGGGLAGGRADSQGDPPLSNPDKVFWPADGYTKKDLFDYYRKISPWLLPYLADRPLVLTRYPDGIDGKSFYQKSVPVSSPEWIRTEIVESEGSDKTIEYFVVEDRASLLYMANLGSIPLHVWASRIGSLERPDWCILDLDPKGAPFEHVVRIARILHEACEDIELPNFVKTSGSSGLHVLLPLGRAFDYDQSRTLGELLARVVLKEAADIATIARSLQAREGKVYIDYLQNRRGQLLVAPFSVRPVPGASVSTPIAWHEVHRGLDIHKFTIRSVPKRLSRAKTDPLRPLLDVTPDLPAVLARLAGRL